MKTHKSISATSYVEDLLGHGRYTFKREEARHRLGISSWATYLALRRLVKAGNLVMPRSGFYVIVDPQHRSAGTLPAEWFIHSLMEDIDKPYYVGLLSAAQIHGAAHHQPQEFQVIIQGRSIRPIMVGNVSIRFYGKGPFKLADTSDIKTPTGIQLISTPETTAWDLVRYHKAAGGLDNVITVLSELAEKLDAKKMLAVAKRHNDILVAQRLGWLLEKLKKKDVAIGLANWVAKYMPPYRALDPSLPYKRKDENPKWRLWVNAKLEPES